VRLCVLTRRSSSEKAPVRGSYHTVSDVHITLRPPLCMCEVGGCVVCCGGCVVCYNVCSGGVGTRNCGLRR
jgi:hypothetical protein